MFYHGMHYFGPGCITVRISLPLGRCYKNMFDFSGITDTFYGNGDEKESDPA